MTVLKVAVVGVGALGRHHARILSTLPGVELVAVVDSHPARGAAIADQCQTRWVADYHDLPLELDAVSVVVPTVAHLSVAAHFLERHIPVLVEKPLAENLAAAVKLAELAERYSTLLQVGHIERFNPAFQAARSCCHGANYFRAERMSPFTFRSTDISVVHDLMIHDLDLVLSLVDSPLRRVEARGYGWMGCQEDTVQAHLTFENGAVADLTASRINPVVVRQLQTWSLTGCCRVDLNARTVERFVPSDALLYGTSPIEQARQPGADLEQLKRSVFGHFIQQEIVPVAGGDALTLELESFLHAIRTGTEPLVGPTEALAAMKAAELVLESVRKHRWDAPDQPQSFPLRKAA